MIESEVTIALLREIRDAIVATDRNLSARIDGLSTRVDTLDANLSSRIDQTNARLDVTNERLSVVEHVVNDAAAQIVFLGRYVKNSIEDLRERVTRLEAKVDT